MCDRLSRACSNTLLSIGLDVGILNLEKIKVYGLIFTYFIGDKNNNDENVLFSQSNYQRVIICYLYVYRKETVTVLSLVFLMF